MYSLQKHAFLGIRIPRTLVCPNRKFFEMVKARTTAHVERVWWFLSRGETTAMMGGGGGEGEGGEGLTTGRSKDNRPPNPTHHHTGRSLAPSTAYRPQQSGWLPRYFWLARYSILHLWQGVKEGLCSSHKWPCQGLRTIWRPGGRWRKRCMHHCPCVEIKEALIS